MGVNELLEKLIQLRGPCPEICDGTIALGGFNRTSIIDIHSGLPIYSGITCPCDEPERIVPAGSIVINSTQSFFSLLNSDLLNWFPTTGDFTFEFFMREELGISSISPTVYYTDFSPLATPSVSDIQLIIDKSTNNIEQKYPSSSFQVNLPINYPGQWVHLCFSRESGVVRFHVDGQMLYKITGDTTDMSLSIITTYPMTFGNDLSNSSITPDYYWYGQLSNIRWTNSAVYTGDTGFSVPTQPLTILPETKLLMLARSNSMIVKDETGLNNPINSGSFWSPLSPFS